MPTDIKNIIQSNVTLAPFTTIQLGGPAKYFVSCTSTDEIIAALTFAQKENLSVHILGGGSNTIFSDQGFDGLVIKIDLTGISLNKNNKFTIVTAGAGERWDDLVTTTIKQKLSGLECLSGIPGTVGATPVQNVGAYGQDIAKVLDTVQLVNRRTLQPTTLTNQQCHFRYRSSRFKSDDNEKYIITAVAFKLSNTSPHITYPPLVAALGGSDKVSQLTASQHDLELIRQTVINLRQQKSMIVNKADPNTRSCGSFFANPIISRSRLNNIQSQYQEEVPHYDVSQDSYKIPAAWLIAQAGFSKGYRHKGVGISANHNLALVNHNGTTAELLELAGHIQNKVKNQFNITLSREPAVTSY